MNVRLATSLLTLLGLGGAFAPAASADSVVVPDPTAANVTVYGSTAAYSRRADDGTYRLMILSEGSATEAPVPPSRAPYDPDLGPTASNGRTVVYARGGDLYRFDVGSTAERKLTRLSSSATERAPSFYKESITFSRAGSRPGWYLYRPGKALKRVSKVAPLETDIAATRVAGRFFGGARSVIRQSNFTGADLRTIARAHAGEKLSSPTLTRFNVFWLRDLARSRAARAERVGVNAHRGLRPLTADHAFSSATSLATTSIPVLYTSTQGIMSVDPKLKF